jgi:hypothetical protein
MSLEREQRPSLQRDLGCVCAERSERFQPSLCDASHLDIVLVVADVVILAKHSLSVFIIECGRAYIIVLARASCKRRVVSCVQVEAWGCRGRNMGPEDLG